MIIYGMAGMAGIGAIAVLFMSSRKLKAEEGQGQQGIDPSQLQGYATSASSGGYQTVRGEAQLKGDQSYEQTRSVYEEEKKEEPTSSGKFKRFHAKRLETILNVRAGRNPPSVLTIFRFAAYLNQVQELIVRFGLAPRGSAFSFLL